MKNEHFPLNLNLIISFKDNRQGAHSQLLREIEDFVSAMDQRIGEIKAEMEPLFGEAFPITIAPRTLKSSRTYYWRYRAKDAQRKYARLSDPLFKPVIAGLHPDQIMTLKSVENEVLAINANLVVTHSLTTAITDLSDARNCLDALE